MLLNLITILKMLYNLLKEILLNYLKSPIFQNKQFIKVILNFMNIFIFNIKKNIIKDPCLSLPLDNITCKNCQQVITINIFKDEWKCR